MTHRISKNLYMIYLICLPLFIIGIELMIRQVGIISSMTYSTSHHWSSFVLTILLGIVLGADSWLMKNSRWTQKNCCYLKLADMVLLLIAYEVVIHGLISFLPVWPVSALLLAAGYQLMTAVYSCRQSDAQKV
ncbi:hypothetical protein [Caproicibacter sp.]|uniref:hypothetical protein n=1 Tax=Caproicibacter sp. TaxID=2814884 RepID=UPI00398A0ED5